MPLVGKTLRISHKLTRRLLCVFWPNPRVILNRDAITPNGAGVIQNLRISNQIIMELIEC